MHLRDYLRIVRCWCPVAAAGIVIVDGMVESGTGYAYKPKTPGGPAPA